MSVLRLFPILLFLVFSAVASASSSVTPLVETRWLAENMDAVLVLDVRAEQKSFSATPVFKKIKSGEQVLTRVGGHIPGAQFIAYKQVRGDQAIDGKTIKFMTASSDKFEKIMRTAGANQDSHIIITTNAESGFDLTMAARMYWQIKYFGHDKVSLLNGGTAQWIMDSHKVASTATEVHAGNWQSQQTRPAILANSKEVMAASESEDSQIVDVRPLGQYLGTFKSGKAKAKGHIPGAKAYPVDLISTRNMPVKFSPINELEQLSLALNINDQEPIITYCNSGHMASGGWFVFHELLGNHAVKLYDGSMHQWTHEDRPVVTMLIE